MERNQVFISYSHLDTPWLERFQTVLKPLVRNRKIDVWSDKRIRAGQRWKEGIEEALAKANVAVLLVSQNFLASDFIADEEIPPILAAAAAEGLTIIWVPITAALIEETEIAGYQAAHDPARPLDGLPPAELNQALVTIARTIRDAGNPASATEAPQPREGRIREVSVGNLPEAGELLEGRESEIERLDQAWRSAGEHVVTVVARGGEGKTNLVRHWLNRMAAEGWRDAERVYAWSFFSQGTNDKAASADQFIEQALRFFGVPDPEAIKSPHERGERLAQLAGSRRNLLVLDGLEPLQYPPGPMEGRLKDPSLQTLLSGLSAQNRGLCVITSREPLPELASGKSNVSPKIDLSPLTPAAGARLLEKLGVNGTAAEREAVSQRLGGHALSIQLLGSYLAEVFRGDVTRADQVALFDQDREAGGHARRILESYERWLSDGPAGLRMLAVLRLLGFFDRPADLSLLEVLREEPPIPGLTETLISIPPLEWNRTMTRLRKLKLINEEIPGDTASLDAHPLIREHFSEQLSTLFPDAFLEGHRRLYEHLKRSTVEQPDTLQDMMPLYQAIAHGCKAGLIKDAWMTVMIPRIQRGNRFFSTKSLGAFGVDLSAFANFFDQPWHTVSKQLNEVDQGSVLSLTAFRLRAVGRLRESLTTTNKSRELRERLQIWGHASIDASNVSQTALALGDVASAIRYAERSIELGDRSDESFHKMVRRTFLGDALHAAGLLSAARAAFTDAEQWQANSSAEFPIIYSTQGYAYCDLLLDLPAEREELRNQIANVRHRGTLTLRWALESNASPLSVGYEHITLARTSLAETELAIDGGEAHVFDHRSALASAGDHLNTALALLREAGAQEHLPLALLYRAALWRIHGMIEGWGHENDYLSQAERDLNEAQQIAERGEMLRWRIEAALERARLYDAAGAEDLRRAREALAATKRLVKQTERPYEPHLPAWEEWRPPDYVGVITPGQVVGYHRRNAAIARLEAALG